MILEETHLSDKDWYHPSSFFSIFVSMRFLTLAPILPTPSSLLLLAALFATICTVMTSISSERVATKAARDHASIGILMCMVMAASSSTSQWVKLSCTDLLGRWEQKMVVLMVTLDIICFVWICMKKGSMWNHQSSQDWNDLEVVYASGIEPDDKETFQDSSIFILDVTSSIPTCEIPNFVLKLKTWRSKWFDWRS